MKTLEICTGDPEGIQTAFEAGANRMNYAPGWQKAASLRQSLLFALLQN